jgi:hypothetical protein
MAALVLMTAAIGAGAQQKATADGAVEHDVIITSGRAAELTPGAAQASGAMLGEIDDPWTGARWQMQRSEEYPAGPYRLRLVDAGHVPSVNAVVVAKPAPPRPVIHPGDLLTVEEHTAVVDASLQAVAMGQAVVGEWLNVRLKLGGKVLQVMALGAGRAAFQAEPGGRP